MQSEDMEWPIKPPEHAWAALTAEEILDGWRDRIERVASEESTYLAALPYVKAIAVIGGTGRGSPYPLSDIDMLTVVEQGHGEDPEELVRQVERERNARLAKRRIPNDIEPSEWVILAQDLEQAVAESEDAFLSRIEHPHWLGTVIKSVGGRVFHDSTGHLPAFLNRCNDTFCSEQFVQLWLRRVITHCGELLDSATRLIHNGDYMGASVEILRAAYQRLPAGAYAVWRTVPQSSGRGVTRFLAAAERAGAATTADLYLAAARLDEKTTWERFAAVPLEAKRARDLDWTVRRGAGEDLDELSATRDILNISLWRTVIQNHSEGERPKWTGATRDKNQVCSQYDAACALLKWLCEQSEGPTRA